MSADHPEVAVFCEHKGIDYIISGLNIHCFKGSSKAFTVAVKISNNMEVFYQQTDYLRINLSILRAIYRLIYIFHFRSTSRAFWL